MKSAQSLKWAKEIIDLEVKDPEMFSSLSLFEDGPMMVVWHGSQVVLRIGFFFELL